MNSSNHGCGRASYRSRRRCGCHSTNDVDRDCQDGSGNSCLDHWAESGETTEYRLTRDDRSTAPVARKDRHRAVDIDDHATGTTTTPGDHSKHEQLSTHGFFLSKPHA